MSLFLTTFYRLSQQFQYIQGVLTPYSVYGMLTSSPPVAPTSMLFSLCNRKVYVEGSHKENPPEGVQGLQPRAIYASHYALSLF